jgi:hypothetical protein
LFAHWLDRDLTDRVEMLRRAGETLQGVCVVPGCNARTRDVGVRLADVRDVRVSLRLQVAALDVAPQTLHRWLTVMFSPAHQTCFGLCQRCGANTAKHHDGR